MTLEKTIVLIHLVICFFVIGYGLFLCPLLSPGLGNAERKVLDLDFGDPIAAQRSCS